MKRIITVALNPAIDKSASVAHVVAEHKLHCTPPRFEPGGGGVNVSRAIKKLGGESLLLYPSGGLTGKRLQELLNEEGLNHRPFPIEGMIRESLVILEESTGRQYRFGMPGLGRRGDQGGIADQGRGPKNSREGLVRNTGDLTGCCREDTERLFENMVSGF